MRVISAKTTGRKPSGAFGHIKRHNDAVAAGEKRLDVLPVSSAKPTLPRVKFLEGKDDVK